VHDVYIHDYGTSKIVSLHVNVESKLSFEDAHGIAEKIEEMIMEKMGYSTIIHLEPKTGKSDEKISSVLIENILKKEEDIISFHKVQISMRSSKKSISMHITVDEEMSVAASHRLCHKLEKVIARKLGDVDVDIHVEPCKKNCDVCRRWCDVKED
jgi:divalent metal cation (Fe/Co/Zn/Cd) transporter